jgi:hypothetical protein
MVGSFDNLARYLLPASLDVSNPLIGQNIFQSGPLLHVHFEHAADDISAFTRQDTQEPPRTLDDLLTLARLLRSRWERRRFLARCSSDWFAEGAAGLSILRTLRGAVLVTRRGLGWFLFRVRLCRRLTRSVLLLRRLRRFALVFNGRQVWSGFNGAVTLRISIRDRGSWRRGCDKESIGVIADAGLLPRKSAKCHAAEDNSQRPYIRGPRVILLFVVHLWCQVGVGSNNTCSTNKLATLIQRQIPVENLPEARTMSFSKGYRKTTALPKSISFMMPCSLTTTLSNFKSRWASPMPCR